MNIPTFISQPWTDKEGNLTPSVEMYNDELNQAMQNGLSDNGWTVPQLTTTDITKIAPDMPNGTLWYDTTTNELKCKVNNVVIVIS